MIFSILLIRLLSIQKFKVFFAGHHFFHGTGRKDKLTTARIRPGNGPRLLRRQPIASTDSDYNKSRQRANKARRRAWSLCPRLGGVSATLHLAWQKRYVLPPFHLLFGAASSIATTNPTVAHPPRQPSRIAPDSRCKTVLLLYPAPPQIP